MMAWDEYYTKEDFEHDCQDERAFPAYEQDDALEACNCCDERFGPDRDDFYDGWCYECAEGAFNEKNGLLFAYETMRDFVKWYYDIRTEPLESSSAVRILFTDFAHSLKAHLETGKKEPRAGLEDYCFDDIKTWIKFLNQSNLIQEAEILWKTV